MLLRLVFLKHHLIGGSEPAESKVKLLLKAVSLLGESEEAGLGEAHLEGQALGTGGTWCSTKCPTWRAESEVASAASGWSRTTVAGLPLEWRTWELVFFYHCMFLSIR